MTPFNESTVESATLSRLTSLGWQVAHGPDIAPRRSRCVTGRLWPGGLGAAVAHRPCPSEPGPARRGTGRRLTEADPPRGGDTGGPQPYLPPDADWRSERGIPSWRQYDTWGQARIIDFDDPSANDWLAVNQFTVARNQNTRRSDIVLFLNGLPLGIIELKNTADEDADIWSAWRQLQA